MKFRSNVLVAIGVIMLILMVLFQITIRLTHDSNFSFDYIFLLIPTLFIIVGSYPDDKNKDDKDKKDDDYDDPTRP